MPSLWQSALYLACLCLVSCSGNSFTSKNATDAGAEVPTTASEGDSGIPPAEKPPVPPMAEPEEPPPITPLPLPLPSSAPEDLELYETPCGTLRGSSAENFSLEICIPGGQFMMGTNEPNLGEGLADHTPAHSVEIEGFILDAFEVTVLRYQTCVQSGECSAAATGSGCSDPADPENHNLPATCVTWEQANTFCQLDQRRRLPSEAEWEYAARGEQQRPYPWGEEFACDRAIIGAASTCRMYPVALPMEVGSAPLGSTPAGVHDLSGNAAEWVADWFGSYSKESLMGPTGPSTGSSRVLRGGAWRSSVEHALSYTRKAANPTSAGTWGFRCARDTERQPVFTSP